MRYKQLLVLILGAAISYGIYSFTQTAGNFLISKYYLNETAVSERLAKYEISFENYIEKNHISIADISAISQWVREQKNVYLSIYNGDETIYESGWWDESTAESSISVKKTVLSADLESEAEEMAAETSHDPPLREIEFSDGTYAVSIIEFSEIKWYDTVTYISWGAFFTFLFLSQIIYNHRVISHIMKLSKEVASIGNGDLEQAISRQGNDEISLLAMNADNMRNSIIARLQSENEAWAANSELITSMSHDIRTPLTSLIGYLEILDSKNYDSQEQLEKYIKKCKEKSIQLKYLSDRLFQYFLIFGNEKIKMEPQVLDVDFLFQQILFEYVFDLKNLGFQVTTRFPEQNGKITVDTHYLKRLFDNLFSNIEKYANPKGSVAITGTIMDNTLSIKILNENRNKSSQTESTNIGLKTCQKIVEQMNGVFNARKDISIFEISIVFPIQSTEEV